MSGVKWGILFLAVFFAMVFGVEYKILLLRELTITKMQYNRQLDTCLTDTLCKAELGFEDGEAFFFEPDNVKNTLEKQLEFVFPNKEGIVLLILYEPEGFYYYVAGKRAVSEMVVFEGKKEADRLDELEEFMEEKVNEHLKEKGKNGRIRFTFPREERASYGQTIRGTGLLMLYEAEDSCFDGETLERFILSGAKVGA